MTICKQAVAAIPDLAYYATIFFTIWLGIKAEKVLGLPKVGAVIWYVAIALCAAITAATMARLCASLVNRWGGKL